MASHSRFVTRKFKFKRLEPGVLPAHQLVVLSIPPGVRTHWHNLAHSQWLARSHTSPLLLQSDFVRQEFTMNDDGLLGFVWLLDFWHLFTAESLVTDLQHYWHSAETPFWRLTRRLSVEEGGDIVNWFGCTNKNAGQVNKTSLKEFTRCSRTTGYWGTFSPILHHYYLDTHSM